MSLQTETLAALDDLVAFCREAQSRVMKQDWSLSHDGFASRVDGARIIMEALSQKHAEAQHAVAMMAVIFPGSVSSLAVSHVDWATRDQLDNQYHAALERSVELGDECRRARRAA